MRAMEAKAFHARLPEAMLSIPQSSPLEGEEIRSQTLQNGIFEHSILLAVCSGQLLSLSLCPWLAAGREDEGPILENAKRAEKPHSWRRIHEARRTAPVRRSVFLCLASDWAVTIAGLPEGSTCSRFDRMD